MPFLTTPVPTKNTFITTLFAQIDSTHSKPHGGVDFAVPTGTTVISPEHGRVSALYSDAGGGNVLEIKHDSGVKTVYMHLSSYFVKVGQEVQIGQPVALTGGAKGAPGAGHSTGPHLHFEVHDSRGVKLDPMNFVPGVWTLSTNMVKLVGQKTIAGAKKNALPLIVAALAVSLLLLKRKR